MAVQSIIGPPATLEAGNTYIFTDRYTIYPPNLWTLKFVIISPAGVSASVAAIMAPGDASSFQTTLNAAFTGALTQFPGSYDWVEYVTETSSGQRTTAATGVLDVIPDLSVVPNQTFAQQMVATLQTAILQLSSSQNQSVSVQGQSFTKKDLNRLTELITYWEAQVLREQERQARKRGQDTTGRIQPKFQGTRDYWPPYLKQWPWPWSPETP